MSAPVTPSVRSQLMRLSLILILVSVTLSCAGSLSLTLQSERKVLGRGLLTSASILAETPLVREALQGRASREELAEYLDSAAAGAPDIDLILVADRENRLRYAPDPSLVGTVCSGGDEAGALAGGAPYVSDGEGPLDAQHTAYAPVRDEDGAVAGYVAVGVHARSVKGAMASAVVRCVALGLLAAGVGVLLSWRLSRRIKDSLLGYEPDAIVRRFLQREDILEALEEGVLAIDKNGGVIFLNAAAAQMLALDRRTVLGQPLRQVYPGATMDRVLRTRQAEYNVPLASQEDIQVISDRLPLYEDGELIGAVGIFRNRTEVTRLTNDLTGVHHLVEALRAYTHEFMNKLHVILGLLELDQPERARGYILETTHTQQEVMSRIVNQIQEPSVAALLVGKTCRASELGVRLILDRESSLQADSAWLAPNACVTVLGNLIENAIESLDQSRWDAREVRVSIRETEESLLLCVEDTGPGIPGEIRSRLFQRGVSSKGVGRGTGLARVKGIVEAYRGSIRVESEPGVGTSFFITFRREDRSGEVELCTVS